MSLGAGSNPPITTYRSVFTIPTIASAISRVTVGYAKRLTSRSWGAVGWSTYSTGPGVHDVANRRRKSVIVTSLPSPR
jgi:hypothetical protein